jgi:hypothetical protein
MPTRPPGEEDDTMIIRKYGRYWALYDVEHVLICLCVYKKGAQEVIRRLQAMKEDSM